MGKSNANTKRQQASTPEATDSTQPKPNPAWFKPVMFGLMLLGLIWIVVFYISGSHGFPIPALGQWNILVGFGIAMVGFLMSTQWR